MSERHTNAECLTKGHITILQMLNRQLVHSQNNHYLNGFMENNQDLLLQELKELLKKKFDYMTEEDISNASRSLTGLLDAIWLNRMEHEKK